MTRSDVADSLAKWRDAVRDAERTPLGTYDRTIAESYAERLHQEYLRAVLRMTGRRDQLEGVLQERYGIARDEAKRQIDRWFDRR